MFKTFSEFLNEEKQNSGNYVSIGTTLDHGEVELHGGIFTKEPHVTLMYSKDTNVDKKNIDDVLSHYKEPIKAVCDDIKEFDDGEYSAIVLHLKSEHLEEIHGKLSEIGLKHSYDYEPHLTFAYKVPKDKSNDVIKQLKQYVGKEFVLDGFVNQEIIENWAES